MPCTFVKGQVLADLVAKFAKIPIEERVEQQNMDEKLVGAISLQEPLSWKVYVDGVVNHRRFGVGLVLMSPEMITIKKSLRLGFLAINNEVLLVVGVFTKPHKLYKLQKPHQNRPQNGITTPQVIVHRIAPHHIVQCGLQFYNKKITQTTPHRTISIYYIYLFLILSILLIV